MCKWDLKPGEPPDRIPPRAQTVYRNSDYIDYCPWVFRSLSGITCGHDDSYLITHFRKAVSSNFEKLEQARLALGGEKDSGADFAMVIPVFDWFPCRFCFWEADDEFDSRAVFYWDANTRQFVHYETLWFMNMYLSQRIWAAVEGRAWG